MRPWVQALAPYKFFIIKEKKWTLYAHMNNKTIKKKEKKWNWWDGSSGRAPA
jgi:hypothetical protein